MSHRNDVHVGSKGYDGKTTNNKGESQQNPQPGATGVSQKTKGTHRKDESHGADKNTTKKQSNAI